MTLYDKVAMLRGKPGAWGTRIGCELQYAASLSTAKDHKYDALVEAAADALIAASNADGGVVTRSAALACEEMLLPLSADAKSYRVHCAAHAHIDMNWRWGFHETASLTVDTFRTMLDLMEEYPDFCFGQSQASTYQIIEEFAPEMIAEIKKRVHEGRWDVTASTWVENDQNMPNGESMARHILYTKRYLSKLLDIPADQMQLNFQPDTFGHNISVPEICAKGGVKYYYHMRGNKDHDYTYRWRARSGAELLVWYDPFGYNGTIDPGMMWDIPQLCERYGINCFLRMYGVGDHGGGPTRRDLNRIIEMNSWPIMPTILFSTFPRFFAELEAFRDKIPVREGEINYIFTGCYTSQSRIKMANRIAEDRSYESEWLGTAAHFLGNGPRYNESFTKSWKNILFNHFHDILPGSGLIDTREYALGQFQRSMAAVDVNANNAMRNLASAIDTSSIVVIPEGDSTSQGAGVGFMLDEINHYGFPKTERGLGKTRIFHFFNPTQYDFDGVSELTVWDWNYDAGRAEFTGTDGVPVGFKVTVSGSHYWGHRFTTFALRVKVPAFGYATYTLNEAPIGSNLRGPTGGHIDPYSDDDLVMENDKIKAVFDHATMQLISLVDKASGEDMIALPSATFRFISENTVHGMTSWRVGDYMTVENLNETQKVRVYDINLGGIRKWIRYDLSFGTRSKLNVTVTLDDASSMLSFEMNCDFQEAGNSTCTPQLNFTVPVAYAVANYRYDVPFGTIDRPELLHDVPANSFGAAINVDGEDKPSVMVVTDTKYGFRGCFNSVSVSLIRGSSDPDPYPEYGNHFTRIGVGVVNGTANKELFRQASRFVHPLAACSARKGAGKLPMDGRLFELTGDVRVSAVKTAEDFDGMVIRLFDEAGAGSDFTLTFTQEVSEAFNADLSEKILGNLDVSEKTVSGKVEPFGVKTVLVKF